MIVEMPIEEYVDNLWKAYDVDTIESWDKKLAEEDFKREWDAAMEPSHITAVEKTEKAIRENLAEAMTCGNAYIRAYAKLVSEESDAT